ncbi:hypothetical protein [Sphingosinicella sp. CPCC 101087]|nr:hypothetical protein [Sphingosinicella sp. CPCC 101087]
MAFDGQFASGREPNHAEIANRVRTSAVFGGSIGSAAGGGACVLFHRQLD